MNITKCEIYRDILGDVSQNFNGVEFIQQRIQEISDRNLLEDVIYLYIEACVFSIITCR